MYDGIYWDRDDLTFVFPKAVFQRKVQSIVSSHRIQEAALEKLQMYIESYLTFMLSKSAQFMSMLNVNTLSASNLNNLRLLLTGRC